MNIRDWTVWLEPEPSKKPVMAFRSEGELHTVWLDSNHGLEDRSDEELQRWLDEGRG